MNERIREVWIKAASEDSDPDNWDSQEQFIERFAGLIVGECALTVQDLVDHRIPASEYSEHLKKHFGVE